MVSQQRHDSKTVVFLTQMRRIKSLLHETIFGTLADLVYAQDENPENVVRIHEVPLRKTDKTSLTTDWLKTFTGFLDRFRTFRLSKNGAVAQLVER